MIVITGDSGPPVVNSRLLTLARNSDGSYTPANAVNQGNLPSDLLAASGLTWDGVQLIMAGLGPLYTLARNGDNSYTPANAVDQGDLPGGITLPVGLAWDGQQLVIVDFIGRDMYTLARNANNTYTPANAAAQSGQLPVALNGVTWDGTQLVLVDNTTLYTLARNANGTYTPSSAVSQGALPAGFTMGSGITWDG